MAVPSSLERGDAVYVVFDDSRPARALRTSGDQPDPGPNETCIRGQVDSGRSVRFPGLEQLFVTPEQGTLLERDLSNMLAIVKTTGSCRAIITDIVPE